MTSTIDFLKSVPYFTGLSSRDLAPLEQAAAEHRIDRGEVVMLEGEPCRGLYIVKSGRIRIFKSSPAGREQVLLYAGPGEPFNDVPVFDGGPNPASAMAIEPSTVLLIPGEAVLALVSGNPVALAVIKVLATRLRRLAGIVEDLSFRDVVSRIAKLLLSMAVTEHSGVPIPRLTQEEMAAIVGSVRDVVGRSLRSLEAAGAITISGQRITIVSRLKLEEFV